MRVILAAIAVLACMTAVAAPATVKTLVYCVGESPDSFNPQLSVRQATFDASSRQIYDRLVSFDAAGPNIVPALATSWRISADGTEYVFRLRKGVSFHTTRNFRPTRALTADDVVFSFRRQLDRRHPWHDVSGGGYRYATGMGLHELIASVTAVDDMTVAFRLTRPDASFLAILAMDFASILSAEYADAMRDAGTPERLDEEPVGSGPFVLVQYQRDALIRYAANRNYWRGAAPIDNMVFAIIPDAAVRLQKLLDGECHVIDQPDAADLPVLMNDPNIRVARQPVADLGFLAFNTQIPFLRDAQVRRALAFAIDRRAIVRRAYGEFGIAAAGPLPPGILPQAAATVVPQADPERARGMLEDAGYQGLEVDIWAMPVSRPYMRSARLVAEMIRDDWAAIGVQANITVPDWETFLKHSMVGAHETILFGWIAETLDPDIFLSPILGCETAVGGANRSRWCDPEFDRLMAEARRAADPSQRWAIYGIALDLLEDQMPVVPLAHSVTLTPLRREVTGYKASRLGGHDFYGVDLKQP